MVRLMVTIERVPAVVAAAAGAGRDRSGQPARRPAVAVPARRGADSRQRAGRERPAGEQARRRQRRGRISRRGTTRRSTSRSASTQPSTGDDQFRRAVYIHWQRQFLHPWLLAFDAPTREECTAQRPISNTPTAALVLLNDPSFVEAARALGRARSWRRRRPTTTSGSTGPGGRCSAATPTPSESKVLAKLLDKHREAIRGRRQGGRGAADGRHFAAAEGRRCGRAGGVDLGQPRAVESERDDHAELNQTASIRSAQDAESCDMRWTSTFNHRRNSPAARFSARRRSGLGSVALAGLLQPQRVRRCRRRRPQARQAAVSRRGESAALRAEGQAGHLPLHGRRAVAPRTFDYKPKLAEMHGQPMPESFTKGQPIAQLQGRELKLLRPAGRSSTSTASRARRSASCFPHIGEHRRRHLHRPLDADRADQPRPGPHVHEHRHGDLRPAEHGLVGHLRPGQRVRRPARLRRAHEPRRHAASRSRSSSRQWHSGFLPSRFQGVQFHSTGRPGALRQQPAGRRSPAAAAT